MRTKSYVGLVICWFVLCAATVQAQCPDGSDQNGDFCYTVSVDEITITGYTGAGGDVILPSTIDGKPVVSIGDYVFNNYTGLTGITIPDSVTTIGDYVFNNCTGLTSITIPDSVTTIERYAFRDCTGLTSVTLGNNVATIGANAFEDCSSLTSITIPGSITTIGTYAFYRCFGLTSVDLPDGITTIWARAFTLCTGLTSITIPDSVTTIEQGAFSSCTGLTSITLPEGVTTIEGGAFIDCRGLTSITIPDSVTAIGDYVFRFCSSLTSIIIPDGVTSIGNRLFKDCTSLASVDLPDSITSIGDNAFENCTSLTSIGLPDSAITIGNNAFAGCIGLTSIDLPDSVATIGDNAFEGCTGLNGIIIPDSAITIGDNAFLNCTGVASATIGSSVTTIGLSAFEGCTSLTGIAIPDSVISIGASAFQGCTSLASITIGSNVNAIDDFLFEGCTSLTGIIIPDSVISIGTSAFEGCTGLASVIIGNSVTSIGWQAFKFCISLTRIAIPASVTSISGFAFNYCPLLSLVSFFGDAPSMSRNAVFNYNSPDFKICFPPDATGYTTPIWQYRPASDCACALDSDCDDGSFCNGEEYCVDYECFSGDAPCTQPCDEVGDQCVECVVDSDCSYLDYCEEFTCAPYPVTSEFLTVSLKGPGVTDVYYYPNEQEIALIELAGTTEDSSLTIKSKLKKTPVYLDALYIDGSLKAIKGTDVVLRGPLAATGGIEKMKIAVAGAGSSLEAAWLGSLSTAGDFAGDMLLTGEDSPPKGLTLGKAFIKGTLDNAQLIVHGNVSSVKVGTWGAGSTLAVGVDPGADGMFFTDDDVPTGGSLKKVKIKEGAYSYNGGVKFGFIADDYVKLNKKDRALLQTCVSDFCFWEK